MVFFRKQQHSFSQTLSRYFWTGDEILSNLVSNLDLLWIRFCYNTAPTTLPDFVHRTLAHKRAQCFKIGRTDLCYPLRHFPHAFSDLFAFQCWFNKNKVNRRWYWFFTLVRCSEKFYPICPAFSLHWPTFLKSNVNNGNPLVNFGPELNKGNCHLIHLSLICLFFRQFMRTN